MNKRALLIHIEYIIELESYGEMYLELIEFRDAILRGNYDD